MKTKNKIKWCKTDPSGNSANINGIMMEVTEINIDILSDYNNLHKMYYTVEDVPPFHLALLFGIQVYDLYYFVTYTFIYIHLFSTT